MDEKIVGLQVFKNDLHQCRKAFSDRLHAAFDDGGHFMDGAVKVP